MPLNQTNEELKDDEIEFCNINECDHNDDCTLSKNVNISG